MPRILVVDDEPSTRALLAKSLATSRRVVDVASDGEEALDRIVMAIPDVVVSDVLMPRMDGFVLARRLRAFPVTATIPIIFVTSFDDRERRLAAFRCGIEQYVAKPVDLEDLALRVELALRRRELELAAAAALRGSLEVVALGSVLAFFAAEKRSGELVVRSDGHVARMLLRDGDVVRASFDDGTTGFAAFTAALRFVRGEFAFHARKITCADELGTTTMALLVEAARCSDEADLNTDRS